jgi:general secretion pathway protein N
MRFVVRLLLLLILLALIAALSLWYLPASFAYRHFGHRLGSSVVLQELTGTVREGRAGQVLINGFPVGTFDWTLDWRGLFRRDVGAQWRLTGSAWKANGSTKRLADGSLQVQDMHMELPAFLLQPVLDVPALNFLGTVSVDLAQLRLRGMIIEEARGKARWIDAGVTGEAQARFGPLQAHFATTQPGHVIGEVQDEAGPLSVDGQFELNGTRYHAEVILRARDPTDPAAQALYFIGQAMPDGGSLLVVDGELQRRAEPAPPAGG